MRDKYTIKEKDLLKIIIPWRLSFLWFSFFLLLLLTATFIIICSMSTMALRELRMDDAAEPSVLKCYKVTLQCYITMLHYNYKMLQCPMLYCGLTSPCRQSPTCPAPPWYWGRGEWELQCNRTVTWPPHLCRQDRHKYRDDPSRGAGGDRRPVTTLAGTWDSGAILSSWPRASWQPPLTASITTGEMSACRTQDLQERHQRCGETPIR